MLIKNFALLKKKTQKELTEKSFCIINFAIFYTMRVNTFCDKALQ